MNNQKKIPVNLVTGFLGSGKTTLIRELLKANAGARKIAVLMNELGEISIDAKLLSGFSAEMYELNDGCICCSVNQDFIKVLDEIAERLSPELIVIETTGVANPMSIIYSLLNPNLVLDAVITTLDAKNFMRLQSEVDVAEDQVAAADAIVLTKNDVATPQELDAVKSYVRDCNPRARLFLRTETPLDLIFGVAYPAAPRPARADKHSHESNHSESNHGKPNHSETNHSESNHTHIELEGIETFRIALPLTLDLELLQAWLDILPQNLWRMKGIISLAGYDKPFALNYAYGRFTIEDFFTESAPSVQGCDLVFIGKKILAERQALESGLRKCALTPQSSHSER